MHRYSKSSIQRTRERCRARENVTRKRARPRKWAWDQIGENVIGEKWIWDETVRRWDRSWDQVCHPHTLRPGVRVCWSGAPERVTPHFCLSRYLHRQANAVVCWQTEVFAPPLLERFTTISIFGVVQVMTTWWKECRELIGLCRSLKRRHRPIGSALIGLPRRSDQRWSADYRRNIGRWSISKESCNISQGWMGSPSQNWKT